MWYWFIVLPYIGPFWKFLAGQYIVNFVNKTSRDKGEECTNKKRKQCNQIQSEITLGRNYLSVGYLRYHKVRNIWREGTSEQHVNENM